jgi:lipopolysaccharide heptosyltransferase II
MDAMFDPKRILILLHGSIGDVTRALPLAHLLRKGFPQASVTWAVEPSSLPLVQNYPAVNDVLLFDRRRWWSELLPFLRKVRAKRFDLVLDLQRHLKSGLIGRWSGAPSRVGFNRSDSKEFNWLFNNHFIPAMGDSVPKLDHYLKFAEYLGIASDPVEWHFKLTEAEEASVDRLLTPVKRRYAVLFVGSRWESKLWFPDQVADCARALRDHYQLDVVLLGGKDDQVLAQQAMNNPGCAAINLVGRTTLREAIGIIARATVAVGPDTGLMHIAAAVGTPVVSLWGATNPARTGPFGLAHLVIQGRAPCAPCYLRRCSIGRICMRSISVGEITAKVGETLSGSRLKEGGVAKPA